MEGSIIFLNIFAVFSQVLSSTMILENKFGSNKTICYNIFTNLV